MPARELTIVMVCLVPIVVTIVALAGLRILKGGQGGKSKQQAEEETRMIQAIYQELSKTEERIEALETILLAGADKRATGARLRTPPRQDSG